MPRTPVARAVFWLAVGVIVVFGLTGIIAGGTALLFTAGFALVVLTFIVAWSWTARRKVRDTSASAHGDAAPATPVLEDDDTPLGATSEQHEELSPHDIPKWDPSRRTAERQAEESAARGGQRLTTGDVDDRPEVVRDDDLRTDVKETGERRFERDEVEWTAEDQGRGEIRGPRSRQ